MEKKSKTVIKCVGIYLLWEFIGDAIGFLIGGLFPRLQEIWLGNYISTFVAELIIFLVFFLIFRNRLYSIQKEGIKFLAVALLPIYIAVAESFYIIIINQPAYKAFSSDWIKLFFIILFVALAIGINEEFFWRRVIFSKLLHEWEKSTKGVYGAVMVSAIMFGLCHYMNILFGGQNFQATTYQVITGACMGVFLAGLYYRTGRIIVPILIHCVSDFSNLFMNEVLDFNYDLPKADTSLTVVTAVLYVVIGLYSIRTSEKYKILKKKS